jgi:endoglucanase
MPINTILSNARNGGPVMDILSTLESMMLLPAPSGYEKEMAYFLKDILAGYADEVHIDRIGNVIAKVRGC